MEELQRENEQLKQKNAELSGLLEAAVVRIEQLTAHLNQNSRNSNWPSSRDKGKKRTRSQRKKSGKPVGGQKGHKGETLQPNPNPDVIETHRPTHCVHCKQAVSDDAEVSDVRKRQLLELPPLQIVTREHQAETVVCAGCGEETSGQFPEGVSNPVQYDANVKQLAVYLKNEQFIPYGRQQQLFSDLFGLSISTASLHNFVKKAGKNVEDVVAEIGEAVKKSNVVHADETGFYVEGERHWLHTASTPQLSYYAAHRNRGSKAVNEIGILPDCRGTLVHDAWATYFMYKQAEHALCNVHHIRDLTAVIENEKHEWATKMLDLLMATKRKVDLARDSAQKTLTIEQLAELEKQYDAIVQDGLAQVPLPTKPPTTDGRRGRLKKSKSRNLVERFQNRKPQIIRFAYDFDVPFDNNLAERDIRMMKVQQKVSGCFRSEEGASAFCKLRSYTSTVRKQGLSVWNALGSLFSGEVLKPALAPE